MKLAFKKINSEVLDVLKSAVQVGYNEYPKVLTTVKTTLVVKASGVNTWYTKLIGLDEVNNFQKRVIELQDKLLTAQDTRREIGIELAAVRKQSNELQDQIHKVKRQEDFQRFLDLMKEETDLLRKEQEISTLFHNQDHLERDIFTAFTNAIRDSHEKQRAQTEYTKYLGLVFGILGSFLSFLYVTFRRNDLQTFIENKMALSDAKILPMLQKLEENEIFVKSTQHMNNESNELIKSINNLMNSKHISDGDFIGERLNENEKVLTHTVEQIRNEATMLLNAMHDNNLKVADALISGNPNFINKSFDNKSDNSSTWALTLLTVSLIAGMLYART